MIDSAGAMRRNLDLVIYKTYADLKAEAARTYVNYLWWIIDPLVSLGIYYIVFAVLFQRGGPGYIFELLVGLVIWRWYAEAVSHGSGTILGGRGLMAQVYLPKWIFPIVCLLTDSTKFALIFVLLLGALLIAGYDAGLAWLSLPLLLVIQLTFIAAVSTLLASLVPFLPDLRVVISNLLMLQMFLSGVFFRADTISEKYHDLFFLNPMARLLNEYRVVLLDNNWPDFSALLYIGLFSSALLGSALLLVSRLDKQYPRLVV